MSCHHYPLNGRRISITKLRSLIATHAPGYRLVPVEPTEAMLSAVDAKSGVHRDHVYQNSEPHRSRQEARTVYRAMLAAADEEGKV